METQTTAFLLDDSLTRALRDQIDTIWLILERPVVQWQLAAFLLVILGAWAVPWLLRRSVDAVALFFAELEITEVDFEFVVHGWMILWTYSLFPFSVYRDRMIQRTLGI